MNTCRSWDLESLNNFSKDTEPSVMDPGFDPYSVWLQILSF